MGTTRRSAQRRHAPPRPCTGACSRAKAARLASPLRQPLSSSKQCCCETQGHTTRRDVVRAAWAAMRRRRQRRRAPCPESARWPPPPSWPLLRQPPRLQAAAYRSPGLRKLLRALRVPRAAFRKRKATVQIGVRAVKARESRCAENAGFLSPADNGGTARSFQRTDEWLRRGVGSSGGEDFRHASHAHKMLALLSRSFDAFDNQVFGSDQHRGDRKCFSGPPGAARPDSPSPSS